MKKLLFSLLLVIVFSFTGFAQTEPKTVVISQEAANKAAENVRVRAALESENSVLKESLKEKDVSAEKLIELNRKNTEDFKEAIHKSELKAADLSGRLIKSEASEVRLSAIIDRMIPMLRQKKIGLINIF